MWKLKVPHKGTKINHYATYVLGKRITYSRHGHIINVYGVGKGHIQFSLVDAINTNREAVDEMVQEAAYDHFDHMFPKTPHYPDLKLTLPLGTTINFMLD